MIRIIISHIVRMIPINYINEPNFGSTPRCLLTISYNLTNKMLVVTTVLAFLRTVLSTNVIGWVPGSGLQGKQQTECYKPLIL